MKQPGRRDGFERSGSGARRASLVACCLLIPCSPERPGARRPEPGHSEKANATATSPTLVAAPRNSASGARPAPRVLDPRAAAPLPKGSAGDALRTNPILPPSSPAFLREPADKPLPRQVERSFMSLEEWRRRHEAQLAAEQRGSAAIAFVGDSITEGFGHSAAYAQRFEELNPLNLGIGGDQTQHVLWRLEQGILRGVPARWVVVLIGINNLGEGETPEETVRGVVAVVGAVQRAAPQAKVLLLALLPAGRSPSDKLRAPVLASNRLLAARLWPAGVVYRDVGAAFVSPDGTIEKALMADALHPTAKGYALLADALTPLLMP